jgi:hypothetical protein
MSRKFEVGDQVVFIEATTIARNSPIKIGKVAEIYFDKIRGERMRVSYLDNKGQRAIFNLGLEWAFETKEQAKELLNMLADGGESILRPFKK